jgi:hypothetical protein
MLQFPTRCKASRQSCQGSSQTSWSLSSPNGQTSFIPFLVRLSPSLAARDHSRHGKPRDYGSSVSLDLCRLPGLQPGIHVDVGYVVLIATTILAGRSASLQHLHQRSADMLDICRQPTGQISNCQPGIAVCLCGVSHAMVLGLKRHH